MITVDNLRQTILSLGFSKTSNDVYEQDYGNSTKIVVDFNREKIEYLPVDSSFREGDFPSQEKEATGFVIHRDTTLNFSDKENFVCLVCIHFLLNLLLIIFY